jgi:hypothetical protein
MNGGELEDQAKDAHGENPNASGPHDGNNGLDGVKHMSGNQTIGGPDRAYNPNDPLDTGFIVELPYRIEVNHITRMQEVKTIWRQGISAI